MKVPEDHRSPACALLPDTWAAEGTLIRVGVGEAEEVWAPAQLCGCVRAWAPHPCAGGAGPMTPLPPQDTPGTQ